MVNFAHIFILLIMAHYLCDFALQNDFVAKFKAVKINGEYNPIWYHCLIAHCAIHALAVYLATNSIYLCLFMFVTHFVIDQSKCLNKLTFNQDQSLHVIVILIISLIYCGAFVNG
jgi:hypothetical protein